MALGRVITFYSYKGGTGRSMALANVAWILALNGRRVLTMDWDLEAPGLHRYFLPFLPDPELTSTQGVIDLVWAYTNLVLTPRAAWPPAIKEELSLADAQIHATALEFPFTNARGCIHFLGAGCQETAYASRVRSFDWNAFYERLGGAKFIEALGRRARQQYDYVLIDSRTGVADTSGICTVQIPDAVVLCFTYNRQSVQGVEAVAKSIQAQRSDLQIFPVAMRAERAVKGYNEARAFALDRLRPFLASSIGGEAIERYWRASDLAYYPDYAFEETLAVFKDLPGQPNTLLGQMLWLAETIKVNSENPLTLPELDSPTRDKYLRRFALGDHREAQLAEIRDLPPAEAFSHLRAWISAETNEGNDPVWNIKLADALDELSDRLRSNNLTEQADLALGDSLDVLRPASKRGFPAAQVRLANGLSKFAARLADLQRFDESLEMLRESIAHYESSVSARADLIPHFVGTLERYGSLLATKGQWSDAAIVLEQALRKYGELPEPEAEEYAPMRAGCLQKLANCQSLLRQYESALVASREALTLRRLLMQRSPEVFEPDYAASLGQLADLLSALGQYNEAVPILQEAEGVYEQLVLKKPGSFESELALVCNRQARVFNALGRLEDARRASQRAATHIGPWTKTVRSRGP